MGIMVQRINRQYIIWEDCIMQEDAVLMVFRDKEKILREEDMRLFSTIRRITDKGNDVMVKRRKDGSLVAYEIKMNKITG